MFGPLAVNWNFNCGLATDILYTLELLCKNSVVLSNKPIKRKLLSHSWLDTKQQRWLLQYTVSIKFGRVGGCRGWMFIILKSNIMFLYQSISFVNI